MFDKVEAFYRPDSVREALRLLQSGRGQARVVAGGTDLVVEGDDSVRVPHRYHPRRLELHSPQSVRRARLAPPRPWPNSKTPDIIRDLAGGLLASVARTCGSVPIRNLATLGGNMANASPAADMATPLLVLDAAVVIADSRGRRKLPLADYLAGAGTFREVPAGGDRSARPAARQRLPVVFPEVGAHGGGYLAGQRGGGTSVGFQAAV